MSRKGIIRRLRKGRVQTSNLETLFHAQKGRCFYCNLPMTLGAGSVECASRDHIIPRAAGGRNEGNLVAACVECNRWKADKPLRSFLKEIGR